MVSRAKASSRKSSSSSGELDPLDAHAGEARPPVPLGQLAHRAGAVDDVAPHEGELRRRVRLEQPLQPLPRAIERALPRRMPVGVEDHRRQRLGERRQQVGGVGHRGVGEVPLRRETAMR
jgi:hypothetical protein